MEAALAREVLSGDWLRLDRMYIDRVRRYEEQRAAGNLTARLIDRGDAYLEDLDQLAIRERIAFFAEMREHLRPKILNEDREEVEAPLHVTYLDALLRHVIDTFCSTERLKELRDRPAVDSSSFRNLSRLEALVRKSEQMLDDDLRAVETNLFQRPEDLFVNILSTEDDLTEAELKDYHLQSYTMKGGPHPVQVRAFLYAVAKEAARRRDTIDLDQLRKAALKAGAVFDDQAPAAGGDDSVRSNPRILEKARRFANQGILDRLTGKAGSFIGEYARYFNVSLNHIRRLAEAAVTYKVLNLLLQEVGALAQTYAGLFTEAGRVLERLVDEVRREEERHTARGGAFSGNLFIYADPDSKRQAWKGLRLRIAGLRQTEAANTALNRAVFQKHRSHRKQRSEVDFRALRQVFETTVIEEFAISAVRKDLAPVWSFSVIEAAKREAALNRGDWRERLKLAVDLVARQAEPFLELDDINRGQAIIFWAISPTIREEYNDSATFDALFTLKQGEQPYEREEFSDRELLCVNNRVGRGTVR